MNKSKSVTAHAIIIFIMALGLCTYITSKLDPLMTPEVTTLRVSGRSFVVPQDVIREANGRTMLYFAREEKSSQGIIHRLVAVEAMIAGTDGGWSTVSVPYVPFGGRLVHLSSRPLWEGQRVTVVAE